ncbi:Gene 66 protein [Xenorhabdus bovienii str. Jollieti]|uniref:Gene 66 protein n=1 Tax=Xenorhabdus bovienii (strain SS-2004) TaxID=406818 RepID=D3V7X3_XENBS|nr:Gp49 family protein [Xenorhabdus bovienii]CBJ81935.1 Gene 66 protein [Xenorhabdus bovienii SS-2004]CDH27775.1 Gene 66 protein [Xenorhabdus bovienii str. Jollieti]
MTNQDIEKETQEKGKTAPRITPQHIEDTITYEMYFTAYDGFSASAKDNPDAVYAPIGVRINAKTLTFCVLTLKNGFTVTGESACASPENFDAEMGRKIARQNAVNKIWSLEGYLLKQKLHDEK